MAKLNRTNRRRGVALLELVISMTVLLVLVFGLLEYGLLFRALHHMNNAARQGARTAIRPDATTLEVQAAVEAALTQGGFNPADFGIKLEPLDPASISPGDPFEIEVSINSSEIGLSFPLIPTPPSLTVSMTMAKEGPP